MRPYTAFCAHALFPLHERLKGHASVAVRRRLETSQWWDRARLEADQVARLRGFLTDIGQHVPHYRDLFARSGFDPKALVTLAQLRTLPLMGKPEIRAAGQTLQADDAGPLTRYNTGGSSGEPLIFYMGKARKSHDVAAKWRATRWWGVDIGDTELVVWGSPIELGAQDRIKQLRDALMRSHLLPAFEMSPSNLDHFVAEIRRVRPAMLFGYPSSLSLIADHAAARGVRLDDLGIRVAFVTSERLYDNQRAAIARGFGCPVANGYGARDAGFIAHECPQGQLHISAEDIVVETVRPDGSPCAPGEAGEIVTTHMATRDFPFVRYRTGDVGVLSDVPCACGRGLTVLAEVQGRTTDFVVARDGTVMHGLALIYTVRDLPGVERFRIEQQSLDRTVVQVVASAPFDAAAEQRIIRDYQARLGQGVEVVVQRVAEITAEASGKFRYVVSRVKPGAAVGS
ncbi:MAG TPA: phenylacetate--CoA ligase family protein [Aquabacterium sp.]|nr:phenylacetate--CoA ligase family protein [Aquabacterium sp.]